MKQKFIEDLIGTVRRLAGEDVDAGRLLATVDMLDGMGGGGAEMLVLREALNGRALHLAGPEHFREQTKPMPVIHLGTIIDDKVLFTTQSENAGGMVLLDKRYDGESIYDATRDVAEAFDEAFTPQLKDVPVDEHHIQQGTFLVRITWEPES